MIKNAIVNFDKLGDFIPSDCTHVFYITEDLKKYRSLLFKLKNEENKTAIFIYDLLQLKTSIDVIYDGDSLNSEIQKFISKYEYTSTIVLKNCSSSYSIDGFDRIDSNTFVRSGKKILLKDETTPFTIEKICWAEQFFYEDEAIEEDVDIILRNVIVTYASCEDDIPLDPLISRTDDTYYLCFTTDSFLKAPNPWTTIDISEIENVNNLKNLSMSNMIKSYVKFNLNSILNRVKWVKDEDIKKENELNIIWTYCWIDSKLRITGNLHELMENVPNSGVADAVLMTNSRWKSIDDEISRLEESNSAMKKTIDRFLKKTYSSSHYMNKNSLMIKDVFEIDKTFKNMIAFSTDFFILVNSSEKFLQDIWMKKIEFIDIPEDIIFSIYCSSIDCRILPEELIKGTLLK